MKSRGSARQRRASKSARETSTREHHSRYRQHWKAQRAAPLTTPTFCFLPSSLTRGVSLQGRWLRRARISIAWPQRMTRLYPPALPYYYGVFSYCSRHCSAAPPYGSLAYAGMAHAVLEAHIGRDNKTCSACISMATTFIISSAGSDAA